MDPRPAGAERGLFDQESLTKPSSRHGYTPTAAERATDRSAVLFRSSNWSRHAPRDHRRHRKHEATTVSQTKPSHPPSAPKPASLPSRNIAPGRQIHTTVVAITATQRTSFAPRSAPR